MTRIRRSLSRSLLAGALIVAGAAPALAQGAPTPAPAKATKPAKAEKVKVLTITEGEDIEGGVPTGQIIPVDARAYSKFSSLIRVRTSFVDLIVKSAENL